MAINEKQTDNKIKTGVQTQKPIRPNTKWKEVVSTIADIKETFGFTPAFINNIPEQSLPGTWIEMKNMRFVDTALDTKLKGLIGLAVASQIPCEMISYFDQKATLADGATRQEQVEAVLMAAITRHWSTVLNGYQLDKDEFKKEADKIMSFVKKMMEESGGKMPPEEMFLFTPTNANDAYKDIEKTLGLVPKFFRLFPKESIAGAWSEFKALQLNPYTELSGKQKELIGLAVAAQIPCDYCVYFHRSAALLNGATESELNESVGLAATARHWSAIFHGPYIDFASFKKDADQMLQYSAHRRLQS